MSHDRDPHDFVAFLDDLSARAFAAVEGGVEAESAVEVAGVPRSAPGPTAEGAVGDGASACALRPWAANLLLLRRVTSTNELGRRIVEEYTREGLTLPPTVVAAWEQTAGRGRHGSHWVSPAGRGAYLSLLRPVADPAVLPTLPLLVPVAVARTVDGVVGEGRCRIKWPNDLLVDGRKISGVLLAGVAAPLHGGTPVDGRSHGAAVIGVGLNHGQSAEELEGLAPRGATSLAVEAERGGLGLPPLTELVWRLLTALAEELEAAGDGAEAVRRYQARSLHQPGERLRCRAADGSLEGLFQGFDERGFLRLELTVSGGGRRAGEEVLVTAGEVVSP